MASPKLKKRYRSLYPAGKDKMFSDTLFSKQNSQLLSDILFHAKFSLSYTDTLIFKLLTPDKIIQFHSFSAFLALLLILSNQPEKNNWYPAILNLQSLYHSRILLFFKAYSPLGSFSLYRDPVFSIFLDFQPKRTCRHILAFPNRLFSIFLDDNR